MEDEEDSTGCISCLSTNDLCDLFDIYSNNDETYAQMLETCFDIKVSNDFKYICAICVDTLEKSLFFKNQTTVSIRMLQSIKNESREEISHHLLGRVASLNCWHIRMGTHRYKPKGKVYISSRGIQIIAPTLENEAEDVPLQIQLKEILRIYIRYGKGVTYIFLHTNSECGVYIRKMLHMKAEDQGPYYDPMSKIDHYKRIILLSNPISNNTKAALQHLFGKKVMRELCKKEVYQMLIRSCPVEGKKIN
ncbi:unnamed protein product [Colias eurytheme]|nr:unnamed protein product [Colias eurytheme]